MGWGDGVGDGVGEDDGEDEPIVAWVDSGYSSSRAGATLYMRNE